MNNEGVGAASVSAQGSQRMSAPQGRSALNYIFAADQLRGRDIIGIEQLSKEELLLVIQVASDLKQNKLTAPRLNFQRDKRLLCFLKNLLCERA